MKIPIKNIPILLVALAFTATTVIADTYYVDTNNGSASDSNPGTIDSPWKTVSHAVDVLQAGDTVYLRGGTYHEYVNLGLGNSGNAQNGYITYAGYPGEHVIMEGANQYSWTAAFLSGINWESVDYVAIKNMEIRNYGGGGICFDRKRDSSREGSHHILLEGLTVHHNNNVGIMFWEGGTGSTGTTHHVTVRNCVTYSNANHGIKFNGDDDNILNRGHNHDSVIESCVSHSNSYMGIHVSTGCYNIIVRNNTCYNNNWQGIGAHEIWDSQYINNVAYGNGYANSINNDEGMVVWNSKNMTIRGNKLHNNKGHGVTFGGDLNGQGSSPIAENNIIYSNDEGGIQIYSNVKDGKIYNNTIARNQGTGLVIDYGCSGHDVKNNVIYQNSGQVNVQATSSFDYNLYYPSTSFSQKGSHSVDLNPNFVNPENGDFHLQSGSPAVDHGYNTQVTNDFEGNSRPQGAGFDIGAYEFIINTALLPMAPSNLRIQQ